MRWILTFLLLNLLQDGWAQKTAQDFFDIAYKEYYNQQYTNSLANYTKSIKLDKHNEKAWYNRGLTHYALKEYRYAIKDYSKAIKLKKDYVNAYINRGISYIELKEYEEAMADFNSAIRLDENAYLAWYNKGICFYRKKTILKPKPVLTKPLG